MVDEKESAQKPASDVTDVNLNGPSALTPRVRNYWPNYKKSVIRNVLLAQLAAVVIAGLALYFSAPNINTLQLALTLLAVFVAFAAVNLIITFHITAPLRDLSAALTHISGEPSDVKPPNLNSGRYQKDGLQALLALLYSLASSDSSTAHAGAGEADLEQALANAFKRTKASVVTMNSEGKILYASPAAPIKVDSDGNKSLELIFDVDKSIEEWIQASANHLVRSSQTWQRISNRLADDPKRRFFDIQASYEQGSETEIIILFIDRTELYQPEEDQLDFISFAAHELRGPVTVIRGYLDVLSQEIGEQISPTHRALIDRLTVSANRLSTYINNILNASRYDRRHLRVHLVERKLADIYHAIADDMSLRASTQNRLLSVSIPADLPTVAADASSVSEVLANLIDNALKYSHEGGTVEITAAASKDFVKVTVTDFGIGMPSNVLGNLFHKFYRSHRSRETVAGTGIGLFISKAIVESHGGMIEAKSEVGKGSSFTFSLPVYASVADKLAASGNSNEGIMRSSSGGWIKNHSKIRG